MGYQQWSGYEILDGYLHACYESDKSVIFSYFLEYVWFRDLISINNINWLNVGSKMWRDLESENMMTFIHMVTGRCKIEFQMNSMTMGY